MAAAHAAKPLELFGVWVVLSITVMMDADAGVVRARVSAVRVRSDRMAFSWVPP